MTDSYKKFKQIVVDDYQKIIKAIEEKPDGIVGVTFRSLEKDTGNLKWETIQHELKYALYVFDLWLKYAPKKDRDKEQRLFWIRKKQPEDKLPPSLQKLYDADRSIRMWRRKVGLK